MAAAPTGEADETQNARPAIARAMEYLDGPGAGLVKGASCTNCHHAPLRTWALREAAEAGLPVDRDQLQAAEADQVKKVIELQDAYRDKQWGHSLSAFLVLGAGEKSPATETESASALREILLTEQTADGSWKAANQFASQRRPQRDADQAQTLWSLLALDRLESSDRSQAAHQRAGEWLASVEPGKTIDVRALRVAAELRWGTPQRAEALLAELVAAQHAYGGWGWQPDDPSDAWATGLALYALSLAGDRAPRPAQDRGREFLIGAQQADGSWTVEGKLSKDSKMATYFGAAWAIIGLSRTMPSDSPNPETQAAAR
jgi:squalene-hopene/tetraprenyl-beta-curcumene cyclase